MNERKLSIAKKNPNKDDKRGDLFDLGDLGEVHINVLTTGKNRIRGGHYHDYPEEFYIISGKLEFHELVDGKEVINYFGPDKTIVTTPNIPHYAKAVEDSVMLEYRPKKISYKATDYDPWRKLAEESKR